MRWLAECSAEALSEALRTVAPELGDWRVTVPVPDPAAKADPLWWSSSTVVDGRFLVKFAWSRPAALRLAREIGVLTALAHELTGAHLPPATTGVLRERFGTWVRPVQRRLVTRWCDWADAVLASPGPAVLVHGDLHGNNQVWDHDTLRLVVDLETVGAAEPEYDLRTFPGPAMGHGVDLLTAVMRHYQQLTGRQLSTDRVMAWHLPTALGDALWRSEAGIPLADHRTPPDWVDDLAARFTRPRPRRPACRTGTAGGQHGLWMQRGRDHPSVLLDIPTHQ
jgi:Phosphotransferase enzyme family